MLGVFFCLKTIFEYIVFCNPRRAKEKTDSEDLVFHSSLRGFSQEVFRKRIFLVPKQIDLFPETDDERDKRFDAHLEDIKNICTHARMQKDLMDAHLSCAVTDLEKGIVRLQKKQRGVQAYLDVRRRLLEAEKMIKNLSHD